MTSVPIRNTPWASWIDPDAWMESMKGAKWKHILQKENALIKKYTDLTPVKKRQEEFLKDYKEASEKENPIPFYTGLCRVHWHSPFFKTWSFLGSDTKQTARDIISIPGGVFVTTDVGDGAEDFELQLWDSPYAKKPVWTKHPVGPNIGILDDKLFYLGVKNKLIYHEVYMCDVATGNSVKCIYKETNPEVNLSLEKHPDGRLLCIAELSQQFTVYSILPNGHMQKLSQKFTIPSNWILPLIKEFGIQWMWQRYGLIITKQHGQKTLWKCQKDSSAKKLLHIKAGDILIDPFSSWSGNVNCLVRVDEPTGTSYYRLKEDSIELIQPAVPYNLSVQRIESRGIDYKPVHGCLVKQNGIHSKGLLAIGYGAYGMPSSVGPVMVRWAPLVKQGWVILYTFIRGGGDHTEEWATAGQRSGRSLTIGDFESLIAAAQDELGLGPHQTVIYGRSAGGLLVGNVLANHKDGDLMGAVYTEVPYVDVLRTTTNPSLPLTVLEYKEFGNPVRNLQDFVWNSLHSPADAATTISTPNIFVLARTAAHDSQVFTYETIKWIRRLRERAPTSSPKLCIVEMDQGHFTPPDATQKQWSLDAALLDSWLHKELPSMR